MQDNEFGKLVVDLRKKKNLTQKQLGDILGVSNKTVSKWENGITKPTVNTLYKLADYFEIPVEELSATKSEKAPSQETIDAAPSVKEKPFPKKKRSCSTSKTSAMTLAAIFFISTFTFLFCLGIFSYYKDAVKVPNVVGQSLENASSKLEKIKLNIKIVFKYSNTVSENVVISQSVSSGSIRRPNSNITLTVSSGAEMIRIPYIEGRSLEEAREILKELGLSIAYTEEFSYDVEKGKIIDQVEPANRSVPRGYTVNVTVSKGQEFIKVPNVVGLSREAAIKLLSDKGLNIHTDIRNGDPSQLGLVTSQSISPDETVACGSIISIIICSDEAINERGNSNSNLMMLGNVSYQGDWVYYSNINRDGHIYKMRNDGSERVLLTDGVATQLNVVGEWIYYYDSHGLNRGMYKIKTDGTCKTRILDVSILWMMVIDDDIYYLRYPSNSSICKMKTDGTGVVELCNDGHVKKNINFIGNWIFYINELDSRIYKMRIDGTGHQMITQAAIPAEAICGEGDYLFLQYDNGFYRFNINTYEMLNFKSDYMIIKYAYNYCDGKIYYSEHHQRDEDCFFTYRICVMDDNGENDKELAVYYVNKHINVANGWIYFMNKDDNSYLYRIRTDGTGLQPLYK